MNANTTVDVAIVGGGPGGLAAAHAIHVVRPDLEVRVYERSTELRRQGNLFSLFPNGQSALKAINPAVFEKVLESAIDFTGTRLTDFQTVEDLPSMQKLMSDAFGYETDVVLLLAWFVLRDALASLLPEGCLRLGHTLQDVTLLDSGTARLTFCDSEEVVDAKVVIGCDGNKSVVRKCVLKDGDPKLMDTVIARGILDSKQDWPHGRGVLCGFNSEEPLSQMFASYLVEGTDLFGWNSLLPATLVKDSVARSYHGDPNGVAPQMKKKWVEALESWPQYVREMIDETPLDRMTIHRQTYRDPEDIKRWGKGCVTLLGDSAHLDTPALGLGVSMALEDAVELGRAVGELGPTEEALRKYEQVRIPRVSRVHGESIQLFRKLVGATEKKFGHLQVEWHIENPWCNTATFEPLSRAETSSS